MFIDQRNISVENRIGYMTEYLKDNYDTQSRMYQTIKDMEAMGADSSDIEEKKNKCSIKKEKTKKSCCIIRWRIYCT